jgi:formylglycine-generating enzyme required for sulfatase activity
MDKHSKINDLFQLAKEQPTEYSFDQAKERFVNSLDNSISKSKIKRQFLTTKKLIIMISSICTISLLAYLLIPNTIEKQNEIKTISGQKSINSSSNLIEKEAQLGQINYSNSKSVAYDSIVTNEINENSISENFSDKLSIEKNDFDIKTTDNQNKRIPLVDDNLIDEYPFPKLTDDEIKANNKRKKEMIKAFAKLDSRKYAFLPAGSFEYEGQLISLQSFIIQKTEVSNLEYKTFLFDLLIQGNKEGFLKAKPDQNQWLKLPGGEDNKMKEHYFSHPSYDNYPVVNISREGAEMYCKWLSNAVYNYNTNKNPNYYSNGKIYCDIRLPLKVEWVYAASSAGEKIIYPWGDSLQNETGMCMANYKRLDAKLDNFSTSTNYEILAPTKSYFPNKFGLYCMSGNVSEMVYYTLDKENHKPIDPGTAGGNWFSTVDKIKIKSEDEFKGVTSPSPMIGFRVVSTHLGGF